MGAILNKLSLANVDNLEGLSPKNADWLTSHADATGLAVVEVERLWNRFRQLTGSNDETRLTIDGNTSAVELTNDVFVRNVSGDSGTCICRGCVERESHFLLCSIVYQTFSTLKKRCK
jgi:hypothetical protein